MRSFHFPVKLAHGNSLAPTTVDALPNIAAQACVGNIDRRTAGLLTLGVVPRARLGARVALRAHERAIRTLAGLAVVGVALVHAGLELSELSSP